MTKAESAADPSVEASGRAGPAPRDLLGPALIFALAVGLRILAIAWLHGLDTAPTPGSDAHEYDTYAWNVAQGRGYRGPSLDVTDVDHLTAYRPPVPSLFFAAIYLVFGHSYAAAQIGNALLGGLAALWLIRLTTYLFDRRAGLLAGLGFAVFPFGLVYSVDIMSEPIAALLVVVVVDCVARLRDRRGLAYALAAGAAFGLLLLAKPGFIFALPFAGLWALIVCGRDVRMWARTCVMGLVTGAAILPWAVRNLLVLGAFIPFGTGGGQLLLCTSNRWVVGDPTLYGYSVMDNAMPEYKALLAEPDDEIRRDAVAKKLGNQWVRENPDKWFYLARMRLLRQWTPRLSRAEPTTTERLFEAAASAYLAAFLAALPWATARLRRRRDPGLMMHVMILGNTAMAVAFHGQHRYRFPTDGLGMAIGAAGIVAFLDALRALGPAGVARGAAAVAARHRWALMACLVVAVGLFAAFSLDDRHIEDYRRRECERRLDEIAAACRQFREREGRPPGTMAELFPRDLPNLDVVHCPKHSISWHAYQNLAGADPLGHPDLVSYRIETIQEEIGILRVVETDARHATTPLERDIRP